MKQFISIFIITILFCSCNGDEPINTYNYQQEDKLTTPYITEDSLLIDLQNLNDSLINSMPKIDGRGLREFREWSNIIAVALADIKGATYGAEQGAKIGGIIGAIIGAIIMSAACSSLAMIDIELSRATIVPFSQNQIELAYVSAISAPDIEQNKLLECSEIKLNIPTEYNHINDIGLYHNLTLKALEDADLKNIQLEDGLRQEEIDVLHSDEFINRFKYVTENPNIYKLDYMLENSTKEERIVQLFIQVYNEYTTNTEDVAYVINKYIDIIEQDNQITTTEKEVVYSALSTAVYSSNYWQNKINE